MIAFEQIKRDIEAALSKVTKVARGAWTVGGQQCGCPLYITYGGPEGCRRSGLHSSQIDGIADGFDGLRYIPDTHDLDCHAYGVQLSIRIAAEGRLVQG
jgi:hypothetical protein